MNLFSSKTLISALLLCTRYVTAVPVGEGNEGATALVAPVPILERDPTISFDQAMRNAFAPAFAPGYTGDPTTDAIVARAQKSSPSKSGASTGCAAQQSNICSSGIPYCCSTTNGKYSCVQSTVGCAQTVICCNNSFGFQMCIGNLDFTLNLNITVLQQ